MRRKNVAGGGASGSTASESEGASESTPLLKPAGGGSEDADTDDDDDDDADPLQSRQGVINLVGIDADHVADFAADAFQYIHSASKVAVSLAFQTFLLGWLPVAAGLSIALLLFPLTGRLARIYTGAQERMMKARDEQLRVVGEALAGVRQIKFAALEGRWEGRILAVRGRVLERVWVTLMADVALFGCWIISPIASSAAALTTYAVLNRGLTASVAFGKCRPPPPGLSPWLTCFFFSSWSGCLPELGVLAVRVTSK